MQPVLAQFAHAAGFDLDDTPAARRAKLEELLGLERRPTLEPFAELLGIAERHGAKAPWTRSARRRRRTRRD